MVLVLAIGFLFAVAGSVAAAFAIGHLYGTNRMLARQTVEDKRRTRRDQRELKTLHSKLAEKAGIGPLYRHPFTDTDDDPPPKKTGRTVVPMSKVVADLKAQHDGVPPAPAKREQVPPEIAHSFLAEVKAITN